jgi:hypothetical protein
LLWIGARGLHSASRSCADATADPNAAQDRYTDIARVANAI